jgi:signal transduction histidine kinase
MLYQDYYFSRVNLGALTAGILSGVLYAFLAIASAIFGAFDTLDWLRLGIFFSMTFVALAVYILNEGKSEKSVLIIEIFSFIYLMSVPLFVVYARSRGVDLRAAFSVSMIVGLALHYAVLRLESHRAFLIGSLASIFGCFFVYEDLALESVRGLVYISAANVTGFVLCRVLEKRERIMLAARVEVYDIWGRINILREDFARERSDEKAWVAAIAHELSQPLICARQNFDKIMSDSNLRGVIRERGLIDAEKDLGSSLLEINSGFLHIVHQIRLSAEVSKVRLRWHSLSGIISEAIAATRGEWSELEGFIDGSKIEDDYYLYADRFLMARVIRNLIDNAINNSSARSRKIRLKVRLFRSRNFLKVSVINLLDRADVDLRGSGVVVAGRPHVGKGLGVGLAIVKNFVSSMPGYKFSISIKRGFGAKADVIIANNFFRSCDCLENDFADLDCDAPCIFIDTGDLRTLVSSLYAERGLRIELTGVDQFESAVRESSIAYGDINPRVFVLEIAPRFLSADSYLGKSLVDLMEGRGRYVFLASGDLHESYSRLGIVIDTTKDIDTFRKLIGEAC